MRSLISSFLSFSFTISILPQCLLKGLQIRTAKAVAAKKAFNAERKQTKTNFKQQSIALNKRLTKISKVVQSQTRSFIIKLTHLLYPKVNITAVVTQLRCANRKSAALTTEFDAFARSVLASGCSARHARDNLLLTLQFLLPQPMVTPTVPLACSNSLFLIITVFHFRQGALMSAQVSRVAWFARQREALGLESMLYAYIALGLVRILILPLTLTLKKSLTLTNFTL